MFHYVFSALHIQSDAIHLCDSQSFLPLSSICPQNISDIHLWCSYCSIFKYSCSYSVIFVLFWKCISLFMSTIKFYEFPQFFYTDNNDIRCLEFSSSFSITKVSTSSLIRKHASCLQDHLSHFCSYSFSSAFLHYCYCSCQFCSSKGHDTTIKMKI